MGLKRLNSESGFRFKRVATAEGGKNGRTFSRYDV